MRERCASDGDGLRTGRALGVARWNEQENGAVAKKETRKQKAGESSAARDTRRPERRIGRHQGREVASALVREFVGCYVRASVGALCAFQGPCFFLCAPSPPAFC
jgi:hypothetical protein